MDLNALEQLLLVTVLKSTEHSTVFSKNETATRYGLIDPILQELGWDLSDPAQVIAEYSVGGGRADYALLVGDSLTPVVFVEAKRLGTNIDAKLAQSITYCNGKGVKYFVITDGVKWQAYDVFKPVPNTQKLIFQIDIGENDGARSVFELLWLWRSNFATDSNPITASKRSAGAVESPIENVTTPASGISLDAVLAMTRKHTHLPPPELVVTPDGLSFAVNSWAKLQITIAEWLINNQMLTKSMCPVRAKGGAYILHTSPIQPNNKPFRSPIEINGMWIEKSRNAKNQTRVALDMANAANSQSIFVIGPPDWP